MSERVSRLILVETDQGDWALFFSVNPNNIDGLEVGDQFVAAEFEDLVNHCMAYHMRTSDEAIRKKNLSRREERAAWRRERDIEMKANWVKSRRKKNLLPSGYIYVLKAGPYYKIGKAGHISKRLATIEPALPFPVEVVHTIYNNNARALEAELHQRFDDKRTNGEWFELTAADLEYIRSIQPDEEPTD